MAAPAMEAPENHLTSVVPPETSVDIAAGNEVEKLPPRAALTCMILVNMVEGIDMQLIPCCLFALQRDVGLTLGGVAVLTSTLMFLSNVAAPFWGIIADRGLLERKSILTLGCLGAATAVMPLAFVKSFLPMIFLRGMAGFFLACMRPICNSLVADMTSNSNRGKVFGILHSGFLVGIFCITLVAGNVANLWVWQIAGWRVVMASASVVALVVAGIVWKFMIEPPHDDAGSKSIFRELWALLRFFRIPTFSVMVLQGIFGHIPSAIMGNKLLFFKLCGLPDWQGSLVTSAGTAAASVGVVLGGSVGDALTKCLGPLGRPFAAQMTLALGIPLMYLQFWGIPAGDHFLVYLLIIVAFGLLGTWTPCGTVLPILAHIVPSSDRSKVMAWEGALESSLATAVGPASVSILADLLFGYKFGDAENGKSIEAATALGKAMAVTICFPKMVSFLFSSLMLWSYPRDIRRLEHENSKNCQNDASLEKF